LKTARGIGEIQFRDEDINTIDSMY